MRSISSFLCYLRLLAATCHLRLTQNRTEYNFYKNFLSRIKKNTKFNSHNVGSCLRLARKCVCVFFLHFFFVHSYTDYTIRIQTQTYDMNRNICGCSLLLVIISNKLHRKQPTRLNNIFALYYNNYSKIYAYC